MPSMASWVPAAAPRSPAKLRRRPDILVQHARARHAVEGCDKPVAGAEDSSCRRRCQSELATYDEVLTKRPNLETATPTSRTGYGGDTRPLAAQHSRIRTAPSIRAASSPGEMPRTRNRFSARSPPESNSICDFRSPSRLLNTSIRALFALPFSGDWVTQTLHAPASRGWRFAGRRAGPAPAKSPRRREVEADHGSVHALRYNAVPMRTIVAPSSTAAS